MSAEIIVLDPPGIGTIYGLAYTDWARTHEHALCRPYPSALYVNVRSGLEWQAYREDDSGWCIRRERKLNGGLRWFRFGHTTAEALNDPRRWRYLGPTPKDHYLDGYDMYNPVEYVGEGYRVRGHKGIR